jgi:hypothetical protein
MKGIHCHVTTKIGFVPVPGTSRGAYSVHNLRAIIEYKVGANNGIFLCNKLFTTGIYYYIRLEIVDALLCSYSYSDFLTVNCVYTSVQGTESFI